MIPGSSGALIMMVLCIESRRGDLLMMDIRWSMRRAGAAVIRSWQPFLPTIDLRDLLLTSHCNKNMELDLVF